MLASIGRSKVSNLELYAYFSVPNAGIVDLCKATKLGAVSDTGSITQWIDKVRPDLALIGPEEELAAGVPDILRAKGVPVMGPNKDLARIESSKTFARTLLHRVAPSTNPRYLVARGLSEVRDFVRSVEGYVIKEDGLAAGKGVRVSGDHLPDEQSALDFSGEILDKYGFVLLEEKLEGEEFTLQAFVDGKNAFSTIPIQDHKRAFEGDVGPNTGGMGSYSCEDSLLPFLEKGDLDQAHTINQKISEALQKEVGIPYQGILYGSFMKTKKGLKVIEFNARFGDPECLNLLSVLDSEFLSVAQGMAEGNLSRSLVKFKPQASVCKYVVPQGYPDSTPERTEIQVTQPPPGVFQYYAKVVREANRLYCLKSRGVAVVGVGDTLEEAEKSAEKAAGKVGGAVYHRKDIGTPAAIQRRVDHMTKILRPTSRPHLALN